MRALKWAAVVWFAMTVAATAQASEVDRLLDLLVNKGTIIAEEAAEFRSEIAIDKQQELDKQAEVEKKKAKNYPVTAKRPLQISGYAQIRGTQASDVKDSFLVRRARLSLAGALSDESDYKLQVDVGNDARKVIKSVDFDKKTTETESVSRPILLDAQVNYALSPLARLSIGQFKIPFSQENLISSTELETINRSQVTEKLVPGRDIGSQGRDVGLTYNGGQLRSSGEKAFDYSFGVFNGSGINATDGNDRKDFVARVVAHPTNGLQLAASSYNGASKATKETHNRTGLDVAYHVPDQETYLKGEYVTGTDAAVKRKGWYALLVHSFTPGWQGVLKFDTYDPDTNKANDATNVWTVGFNRFLSDNTKLQVNYEIKDEQGVEIANNTLLAQLQVKF